MKLKLTFYCLTLLLIVFSSENIRTVETESQSLYSKKKFIVKTKYDLPVSEATGEISTKSGFLSLDSKNEYFKIKKIKQVFKNPGANRDLYLKYDMSKFYVFYLPDDNRIDIPGIVSAYNSDSLIEFSEPDFIGRAAGEKGSDGFVGNLFTDKVANDVTFIPNDEMFSRQWYLKNDGNMSPTSSGKPKIGADIDMVEAWGVEIGSEDIIVAILDSGIRDDHPDLKGRIWVNKNEIPNNGIDDDGNGYIDDYIGWDFAYDKKSPKDGFGHGTNIATVIGAVTNNQIGYAGINQRCKLMNCKNLADDNYGEYSWWAESVKYAVDNGAKVINMSEGGDDFSKTLKTACDYAVESGVLVVAAMMNRGNSYDHYPASFGGVMAIGATDTDDRRCKKFTWGGGSCWGKHIAVVAPGNRIYGLDYANITNYNVYWSGTSQSTAIVSAIASLLLAQDKKRKNTDLYNIITTTALDQVGDPYEDQPGWDEYYGYGRVDCFRALKNNTSKDYKQKTSIENKNKNSDINKDKPVDAKGNDKDDIRKKVKDNDSPTPRN
jgi:subtilisin family serine protease